MKILFLFTLAILAGVISINDVFADKSEVTIRTVSGSSSPGCETSGGCYTPNIATVDQFGRVIFSNTDTAAHTFTSGTGTEGASGEFDSGLIMAGSSYEWTPFFAGEVTYFCMVHPWMTGTVIVDEIKESETYPPQDSSYNGKITVTGTDTVVSYTMTGGKLYSINLDQEAYSLHIQIDATNDGSLTLTLPRTLIDAKRGNSDDTFIVLVNGEEVDFDERTTSSQRTLTIQFPSRTNQIEIIGTTVNSDSNYFPTPYTPQPTPYPPQDSSYNGKITVTGTDTVVSYTMTGGKLYSITPDVEAHSLAIAMTTSQDGSLVITLPRTLIDTKMGNQDNRFFVLVDGEEVYYDEKIMSSSRTLTITFPAGTEEIEVIGTTVNSDSNYFPTPYAPIPSPTHTGTISVSTDNSQYSPSDLVTVKVSTSKSANVAVSVISPSGDNIVSRTVSTDSGGSGSLQFKLPESSQNGSYRVDSTATISGSKVSDSTIFTVKSTLSRVNIVSLQPTDQQGNAVSSFTKGKLGFVKVVLSSDSNANSLVTINLFDSELTSLGIGSFKTTLGSGQSEMTLSFFIPNDAKTGNGDIYANVFSDWPSQGGVPLTGESSTQVRIQ